MNSSSENTSEKKMRLQQRKTSKLAKCSVVFTILTIAVALVTASSLVCLPFAMAGLSFGVIALWQIRRSEGKLTGLELAIFAIVINSALPFVMLHSEHVRKTNFELVRQVICGTNLSKLGKAIEKYAADNDGTYPTVNEWCDLLLDAGHATQRSLVCKSASSKGNEGPCHYAMNPNCEPNSPPDTVLLFESKGGWNQFGGPELLAPENHAGKGCNILFNDGHVDFVETDKLGELKWK